MTQSTLTTFSQPEEVQNCHTCHAIHTIVGDRCRCLFGHGGKATDWCRYWLPEDPIGRYWPKLPDNYEMPKKWRGGR